MTNLADIGKKIKDTTQALAKADSDLKWELAASAADVAGMVDPTPVSDLVGAGLAVRKGDWLGAGMSLVSTVPYLGDAVAKPAKAVRAAKRINELRQTVAKLTAKLADLRKAENEAKVAEAATKKAHIPKQTSNAADAVSAKRAAEGQNTTVKDKKDNDCEDCGAENKNTTNSPQIKGAANAAPPSSKSVAPPSGKALLPNEGQVGTYDELIAAGSKGDNITPHHIPSANHMAQHGVAKGDGISINMEQPHPGVGGRHRRTFTYGTRADVEMPPRKALAEGIADARRIYREDGLYTSEIRSSLQDMIKDNKKNFPKIFGKKKK